MNKVLGCLEWRLMMFVRAYPCETQEMVFDAHDRMIGRSPSSAHHLRQHEDGGGDGVRRQDRQYNRRFLQPVACVLASGWEKGQLENHVGQVRCGAVRIHDRPGYLGRQSFAGPYIPPPNTAVARTRKAPCE